MDMKGIKSYIIAGILFASVLGTFLHFAYTLSGNNFFVGLFTPINESIWEHTKLIFFPMLIYSLFLNNKLKDKYPCIYSATILSAVLGVLLIIVLFYTYSGIIGYNVAFVDISVFYISVITSFYVAYKLTLSCKINRFDVVLQTLNILMICLYIIFTLCPLDIPLFINP
jgi:hypothetical protein